jgi:serine/threonine-protein kinase
MKKILFKKGQKFGNWTLISFLGGGGNGEVWKCENNQNMPSAIKILKSVKSKPYNRFLDETKVIESNSDIIGIIPMIDKFLPKSFKNNVPYYVMPIAESAVNKLKGKNIEEKIDAILNVSQTLKQLHSRGISHRDIKPPNLLFYNSRCSLVDFGLADYPNKKDVSLYNEEIGAKWTMAPEMRRESSKADGLKADIYSLAKTLWIILTENYKGFDGQYSTKSILELNKFYSKIYTSPIDNLLIRCTDNDPLKRPNIEEFIVTLENWKDLNKDFHKRNQEQWFEIQSRLFPTSIPTRVIWENVEDIIKVLKTVSSYDSLNHMFFPSGGGLDLIDARISNEKGCIELDFVTIHVVKSKRLVFESFGYDPEWNYFRLELDELEPSGVYDGKDDEYNDEKPYKSDEEFVAKLYPGHYDKLDIVEYRSEYEESGYIIPKTARTLVRILRGSFVIFNKRSTYNLNPSTYDGRHNKMDTEGFRNYIQKNINRIKEED